jgi:hypothetical protein
MADLRTYRHKLTGKINKFPREFEAIFKDLEEILDPSTAPAPEVPAASAPKPGAAPAPVIPAPDESTTAPDAAASASTEGSPK